MAAGVPIPASHLAPITAFRALADGSGTCAGPGRSLQAAQPPAPLPGSSPGRSWKRESGKKEKERGRVNLGDSGEVRAARESSGATSEGSGARLRLAGSLTANLLAPASWARGARTMCGARSRPPPSASGGPGLRGRPKCPSGAAGGCPAGARPAPQAAGAPAAGTRNRRPAHGFTCGQDLHYGLDSREPWRRP